MIQKVLVIFFCLMILPKGISQIEVREFSHIIVPEQFDFLKGKDTYQLNSLTKFLLKKNGFKAVFESEMSTISRCDVLWADLEREDGMIYTKLTLVLKDCTGTEVARSEQGKSKQKDYKKAYQDAVRKALDGFHSSYLKMIPSDIKEVTPPTPTKDIEPEIIPQIEVVPVVNTPIQVPVEQVVVPTPIENPPLMPKTYNFEAYTIFPIVAGAEIFYQGERIGILIPTSTPNLFLIRSSKFYGIAQKTATGYIVDREVDGTNTLLTMKFE